mmetsp:Transcript_81194/g.243352  ORF Transcript_81194/g.243352 Transcript_81194/m.243352 type:complete len:318 (+) Transcript_81194:496-1449(+)
MAHASIEWWTGDTCSHSKPRRRIPILTEPLVGAWPQYTKLKATGACSAAAARRSHACSKLGPITRRGLAPGASRARASRRAGRPRWWSACMCEIHTSSTWSSTWSASAPKRRRIDPKRPSPASSSTARSAAARIESLNTSSLPSSSGASFALSIASAAAATAASCWAAVIGSGRGGGATEASAGAALIGGAARTSESGADAGIGIGAGASGASGASTGPSGGVCERNGGSSPLCCASSTSCASYASRAASCSASTCASADTSADSSDARGARERSVPSIPSPLLLLRCGGVFGLSAADAPPEAPRSALMPACGAASA